MSDWQAGDLAQQHWVGDLENVVDAAGLAAPFALLGISQGAATSIRYAVRHPERVSHLILYGGYAVGGNRSDDPERRRSEEHTSELQSLMRISYAVFCL